MTEKERPLLLVRVWLLGPFQVDVRCDDGTWETIHTWDRGYGRPLLKRLVCAPGRRLERGMILDDLWPDPASPDSIERYLNDAAYQLRKLLREPTLLKTRDHASTYQLADQSLLWVDADACEDLLKEAEHVWRTSAAALPLLEQASAYHDRGDFLEGVSGTWRHGRRGTVERLRHRGALWLAEAYEQLGRPGAAEHVLSQLLEQEPFDEDVLCSLMQVVHRQGMTSQALRLYEQARDRFASEGLKLSKATKALALQIQENSHHTPFYPEMIRNEGFLETGEPTISSVLQIDPQELQWFPGSSFAHMIHLAEEGQPALPGLAEGARVIFVPVESELRPALDRSLDFATWLGARVSDLKASSAFRNSFRFPFQQRQHSIHREIETWNLMTHQTNNMIGDERITRRMALAALATISTSLITRVRLGPLTLTPFVIEEFLAESTTSVAASWHLFRGDGLTEE